MVDTTASAKMKWESLVVKSTFMVIMCCMAVGPRRVPQVSAFLFASDDFYFLRLNEE